MKKKLAIISALVCLTAWVGRGANPSFASFNTTQFDVTSNQVSLTNGVIVTNISSPGTNGSGGTFLNSQQFGTGAAGGAKSINTTATGAGALATNSGSSAYGNAAAAYGVTSSAYGASSVASNGSSSAFGGLATATGAQSSAYGDLTSATALSSSAFGFSAGSAFTRSTALGAGAITSSNDQVMIGTGGQVVTTPGIWAGNGSGLTSLDAGQLTTGTVPTNRLPSPLFNVGAGLIGTTNGALVTATTNGQTPAGTITGVVPIANGGTASSANQAAGKQVGVFALGNNIPVDTGNYVGQLGVSPNGFLYWWNGTSFASNSFSFLTSPNVFGDPNLAGPNGPVQVNWFLAGDKSQQNSTNNTSDEVVRFMGCDPWGTGGGNGYVIATTNAAGNGTAIGTNAQGNPWYWKQGDINAYSLIAVGEQATNNDLPGFLILVADSTGFPFAWCLNTSISNRQGDFPFAWFDTTNGIEKHPQWVGTNNFPVGTSLENETWQVNNKLNTLTMGTNTQLFGANGGTTLTGLNGTFNLAAFDAAQGGTLNVGNATVQATNFIANQAKGTTAAISIGGLGLIGVTAAAAQEGNELWIGDSSGQVATMSGPANWNRFLIRNVDLGWKTDGGGDIGTSTGAAVGGVHFAFRPNNVYVKNLVQASGGISTLLSNMVAPTSITAPLTTVNWTNPINADIEVYIDNSGVTGTSIKKNGTQIFSSLIGDVTIGLQPNETINLTYTVGTPSIKWSPR